MIVQPPAAEALEPCDTRPMTQITKLTALRTLGRDAEASKLIIAALTRAKGGKRAAAVALGVDHSTLYRLIAELELWPAIDKLSKAKGWRLRAGRARGPVTSAVLLALCVFGSGSGCAAGDAGPTDLTGLAPDAGEPMTQAYAGSGAAGGMVPVQQTEAGQGSIVEHDAGVAGTGSTGQAGAGAAGSAGKPAAAGSGGTGAAGAAGKAGQGGATAAGAGGGAAGSGGAAGATAMPPTRCKVPSGPTIACDMFSQQYFSSWSLSWMIASITYNCNGPAPQCSKGAACKVQKLDSNTLETGVCQ